MPLPSLNVLPNETATDPVCGMSVSPSADTPSHTHEGGTYHFCAERCRRKFVREPGKFLGGAREEMHAEPGTLYICPMCPEVKSDRPAPCPSCGMALEPADGVEREDPEAKSLARRAAVGVVLGLPLLVLAMADMLFPGRRPVEAAIGYSANLIAQAVLATVVVFWCGAPLLARGWASVRNRSPNMFTLIAVGVLAAMSYSFTAVAYHFSGVQLLDAGPPNPSRRVELVAPASHGMAEPFFESAAWIVVLVLVGQWLEARARFRTGEAVRKLMTLAPKTARVILPSGREEDLPLSLIDPGDRVRIRPGERVPVDGVIRDGTSSLNEAAVTGEPLAVEKTVGGEVLAGTMNGLGPLVVEVTKASADTVLAHVIHLVTVAQRSRVPLPRLADQIARWFVPVVLLLSLFTLAVWVAVGLQDTGDWSRVLAENWLTRGVVCAVAVLIIACPCAIGLAAPLAVVVGVGRGARHGVLFRDAAALEKITTVDTVLFDKTGTLTEGKPRLARVVLGVGEYETTILEMAAAVERGSEHPLGRAVVWEADDRGIEIPVATDVEVVAGMGVRGTVHGKKVAVGTPSFLRHSGVTRDFLLSEAHSLRLEGYGVTAVGIGDRCVGLFGVLDPVRPTAADAVKQLRDAGLRVVLVSGDAEATAKAVASKVGIEEVVAEARPVEKYALVKKLRGEGRTVAMVGDGINDAAALAEADVGIALGTGTDVAMSSAGVTLVRPDLRTLMPARELGRRTGRTIRQNLWLAFGYNALAVPVAAGVLVPFGGGLISPVWAAAAMSLSSVSVILNSLRLLRG